MTTQNSFEPLLVFPIIAAIANWKNEGGAMVLKTSDLAISPRSHKVEQANLVLKMRWDFSTGGFHA